MTKTKDEEVRGPLLPWKPGTEGMGIILLAAGQPERVILYGRYDGDGTYRTVSEILQQHGVTYDQVLTVLVHGMTLDYISGLEYGLASAHEVAGWLREQLPDVLITIDAPPADYSNVNLDDLDFEDLPDSEPQPEDRTEGDARPDDGLDDESQVLLAHHSKERSMSDEMQPAVDADVSAVGRERDELRSFVDELTSDDISSGQWFTKLLSQSLRTYTDQVDWRYFQRKYQGLPPDAIVDQRIQMAARYASIEGGLSASAYTGAVALTIGSLGGASPATVPAAAASMMVDVVYTTRLQLRLAYDISVLYRVPLDTSDPDDLWKLVRIAFTVKGGEVVREGLLKGVPALIRPLIKRFYRTGVLQAARGLPVVGKYLLQRNAIKVGIPLVGIPLAVVLNRQTTLIAGRHARAEFRTEARIIEIAENLSRQVVHPKSALWVAWLVVTAEGKISDDEATLLRHLVRLLREDHGVVDDDLARLVAVNEAAVWVRLDAEHGDLGDLIEVAEQVAKVDGPATKRERAVIAAVRQHCERL